MRKRFVISLIASFLLISSAAFGLAYRANMELERIVSSQFNEQQLGLTRQIAQDIQANFQLLEQALHLFAEHFTRLAGIVPNPEEVRMFFDFLQEWGVIGVAIPSPNQDSPDVPDLDILTAQGRFSLAELDLDPTLDMPSQWDTPFSNQIILGRTRSPVQGPFAGRWVMPMLFHRALPPLTSDKPEPLASPGGQGTKQLFVFILDAQAIATRHAEEVRSGKTGYAWVIDHQGRFIFHVEEDFRGENSFTVRMTRNPDISYDRINNLVANRLLRGEEGTDWYISGWHWSVTGEMRKLLAFSPIVLPGDVTGGDHFWSVGLAAPDTEVYGLMQPVVIRQWMIAGLFIIAVTMAFAAFLFIALRWSETLRREVDKKTEHLRHSEAALRQERDKVKRSMEQLLQAQEKLVLSERFAAIGEAAAHLSHEIKNPLMLMAGFAQQVLRTLPEDDVRREKLDIVVSEANRLEQLLIEVRDFTRPPKAQFSEARLNDIAQEVAGMFQEQAKAQDIHCQLDLDPSMPPCLLDPDQVKQVLINLVKNAVEAMTEGGLLTIATAHDQDSARITVQDSGPGIPPAVMKRLFHPFFSTKPKGTGLGLAVSYKLVQDHGGEIKVRSQPGRGTRFDVALPLNDTQVSPDPEAQDRVPEQV